LHSSFVIRRSSFKPERFRRHHPAQLARRIDPANNAAITAMTSAMIKGAGPTRICNVQPNERRLMM